MPGDCDGHFCRCVYVQVIVAGYVVATFQNLQSEMQRSMPGSTPVRRRGNTQSQVTAVGGGGGEASVTPGMVDFCQRLVHDDLSQQMMA